MNNLNETSACFVKNYYVGKGFNLQGTSFFEVYPFNIDIVFKACDVMKIIKYKQAFDNWPVTIDGEKLVLILSEELNDEVKLIILKNKLNVNEEFILNFDDKLNIKFVDKNRLNWTVTNPVKVSSEVEFIERFLSEAV